MRDEDPRPRPGQWVMLYVDHRPAYFRVSHWERWPGHSDPDGLLCVTTDGWHFWWKPRLGFT